MKNMKKFLALALVIVSALAFAVPTLAETGIPAQTYAYTIKGDVAVRQTASSTGNIISRVSTGTQVYILTSTSTTNGYYKVSISGLTSGAYIREDCLGRNAPGSGSTVNKYMYCTVADGQYVNIRQTASTGGTKVGELRRGDMVFCVSSDGTWAKINAPINGYVMLDYLSYSAPSGGGNYSHPQTQAEAFGTGNIQQGNFSYKVANIQVALGLTVDAIFGSGTKAAVVSFQLSKNLDPDGIVGPATATALWNAYSSVLKSRGYTTW